jgi:hypothetical protein
MLPIFRINRLPIALSSRRSAHRLTIYRVSGIAGDHQPGYAIALFHPW